MEDQPKQVFDLKRLAPELQVRVFESLPGPRDAARLAHTCRALHALFHNYRAQILAAIRDGMVAPFYEYYALLGSLHVPHSAIRHPPPGGWPGITADSPVGLNRTAFAVDVMRHLPYIAAGEDDDGVYNTGSHDHHHHVDWRYKAVDYSRPSLADPADCWRVRGPVGGSHGAGVVVAESCIHRAAELVLDTAAGVVSEGSHGRRGGAGLPVREYFALRTRECVELTQVFVPGADPYLGRRDEEVPPYDAAAVEGAGEPSCPEHGFYLGREIDRSWVCHLYRKFGWPGDGWRKEEGLKAIVEYRDRRNAEAEERAAEMRRERAEGLLLQLGPTVAVLGSF